MFVTMGLSAVFPVLHGILLYGVDQMRQSIGLDWVVLQGSLYISGAGLYAVCPTSLIFSESQRYYQIAKMRARLVSQSD